MIIDEKEIKYIKNGEKFFSAFFSFWIYFAFKSVSFEPTLFCSEALFTTTFSFIKLVGFLFIFPAGIFMMYLKYYKYRVIRKEFVEKFTKILWRKKGCLKYFLFGLTTVGVLELINRFVCSP